MVQAANFIVLGKIVAEVAHELNNSLTGVLGFSQLIARARLAPEVQLNVSRLCHEANRTADIVNNVLSLARAANAELVPVDLNEILERTIRSKSYHLRVKNIEVETLLASTLPKVLGNATQVESVFLNIINNAQEAMIEARRPGKLQITTSLDHEGQVVAAIADDGPGIRPERLQHLFEPFFTTREVGTGLGLSICREIITQHGGRIWLESDYGHGATSFIELPSAALAGPVEPGTGNE
jgi:signal transduction histidine kinase